MAKKIRKLLSIVMVLSVLVGVFPLQALAAEEEGLTTTVTSNTTTSTDGQTTVTVTIEQKDTTGTTTSGVTVNGSETTTTTTTVNSDGTGSTVVTVEGSETKEWDEDIKPGEEVPSIEVQLKDGETVTETMTPVESTETEGDTTTTTTTNREASATLESEEKFEIIADESKLECPVGPEEHDKDAYTTNKGDSISNRYFEGLLNGYNKDSLEENYVDDKPDKEGYEKGFDLTWTGYGDVTNGASAVVIVPNENGEIIYLTDENGEIVYENGFPVVDMEKNTFVNGKNGKSIGQGMVLSVGQFALRHENGEYFYAYCMDASTGASPDINKWYNIRNLEDAIESEENPDGYLTEEEAGKIRAIATNGYWGTEDGRGSVDSLKEILKATYGEDDVIKVRYPGSNTAYEYDIFELIDGLTEAEALAATQAAIWTYANNGDVTHNQGGYGGMVTDGYVIGVLSALKCYNGGTNGKKISWLNEYVPAKDGESDARLQALYMCLLGLEPIYADGELREDSTVIPNENVISDTALVIKDKVADAEANHDDNDDNDVYNTELKFSLAFIPGENDEMYVCLMDENNQFILDENGQPIKKLLAAEDSAKSGDDVIKPVDGVYTLTGLKLSENSNFEFDLRLEGTQYLNEGVYIYQAEGGRGESQTLVGLAKGEQKIVVSNKMTISFDVDEGKHVVAERKWESEETTPITPDVPEEEERTPPTNYRVTIEGDGTEEIIDEPVPLAAAPKTGDNSALWVLLIMVAGFGIAALNIFGKKRNTSF